MLVLVFVLVFVPARVVCGALMSIPVFEFMLEARSARFFKCKNKGINKAKINNVHEDTARDDTTI